MMNEWKDTDKIDLNTRFHSLWDAIYDADDEEMLLKFDQYLEDSGFFDDAYKCEWSEIWLNDAIIEEEKILGRTA